MWTVFLLCKQYFSAVQEKFQHNSISISSVKLVFLQCARSISSLWTEYFFTVQTTFLHCPSGISSLCNQYFFSVQAAALHIVLAVHYCEAAFEGKFCSQAATLQVDCHAKLCFHLLLHKFISIHMYSSCPVQAVFLHCAFWGQILQSSGDRALQVEEINELCKWIASAPFYSLLWMITNMAKNTKV